VAHKTVTVPTGETCRAKVRHKASDWETQPATLIASVR